MLTAVYSLSLGAISGILYLATQAGTIVGRIDEASEWEYFRNVISCGVFMGILVVILLVCVIYKKTQSEDLD